MKANWKTTPPKNHGSGLSVLCTRKIKPYIGHTYYEVIEGWADIAENGDLWLQRGCIAWTSKPEHISVSPAGWYNEYRGDDPPPESGYYLVSRDRSPSPFNSHVDITYFNEKEQRFSGEQALGQVLGWQPLPKPYSPMRKGG